MSQLILILHVLVALAIIALVLLQHGKGADAGAAFGSGSSNTMFGSLGSVPFLMKITAILAAIFFATSISLSYLGTRGEKQNNFLSAPAQSRSIPTSAPIPTQPQQSSSAQQPAGAASSSTASPAQSKQ